MQEKTLYQYSFQYSSTGDMVSECLQCYVSGTVLLHGHCLLGSCTSSNLIVISCEIVMRKSKILGVFGHQEEVISLACSHSSTRRASQSPLSLARTFQRHHDRHRSLFKTFLPVVTGYHPRYFDDTLIVCFCMQGEGVTV